MRTVALVAESLMAIQQPRSWHTRVTLPVVTRVLPLNDAGAFAMSTRLAFSVAVIASPKWSPRGAAACAEQHKHEGHAGNQQS